MTSKRNRRQSGRRPAKAARPAASLRRRATSVAAPTPWRQRLCDTLFAADRARPTERWAYLWPLLFAAFLARAGIALWSDFVLHPDEIMQYLEPAHHAAFGNGVLFWEYLYGARSWLIPGAVAGVLKALDAAGLGQPAVYIPVVKLLFCLLSLLVPWAMYRLTQVTVNEQAARLALLLGCFWYELAALAHKPFTEFVGTAVFMTALALAVGREAERPANLFAVGLLAALSGALRMQYAPVALLLLLLRSVYLRTTGLASLWAGALLLTALVGILEWQTWGAPFHSYLLNFFVNAAIDAARAGESSRWLLLGQLTAASGGMALLAFAAGMRRRHLLVLLACAITLTLHLFQEHREYRFIFLLIPCWLMLLATAIAHIGGAAKHPRRRVAAVAAVLAFGIPALLNMFPWQGWIYKSFSREQAVYYLRNQDPMFEAMSRLAKETDVRGVFYNTQANNAYFRTGGYYYLHHDVPLYLPYTLEAALRQRPDASQESLYSHLITEAAGAGHPPEGFELLSRQGDLAVWRRLNNDRNVIRWREHVVKATHPTLDDLIRQLDIPPLLAFFVSDVSWDEAPPTIQLPEE